jgi:lipopolysaccharide transport system ATP-binding protein
MRRAEIERRFDEIVAFAEVERFLDTAVKHYSSGMYLRLAFSVAAHLEPEIVLVDEVLAVGDAAFQKKCMGKMEDVAATGRTVLFVSHNLGAVKELCQTALVLKSGCLDFRGPVVEGVARYLAMVGGGASVAGSAHGSRFGPLRVNGRDCTSTVAVRAGEGFVVSAQLVAEKPLPFPRLKCVLEDAAGNNIVYADPDSRELDCTEFPVGVHDVAVEFPPLWLSPGVYMVCLKAVVGGASGKTQRIQSERAMLDVSGIMGSGSHPALLSPALRWSVGTAARARGTEALQCVSST